MTLNDALASLVLITALRVFAPDLRHLTRRLLRAGVRVGAAALVEDHRATALPHEARTPAAWDEEVSP
ncbi:hypothetical protein [Streptomyces pinistramenti]|uniref:hypothetical protein n=1 Tax=Streptomyces pinistramenti TaxID=2884812 RepID=UPI001D063B9D|nr:hypothetical protein [Streptomyces pinistramenti]MCB5911835.1 hypothetical protein [Streptomyces pinistramenti]